jgi:hypothetical protein
MPEGRSILCKSNPNQINCILKLVYRNVYFTQLLNQIRNTIKHILEVLQ